MVVDETQVVRVGREIGSIYGVVFFGSKGRVECKRIEIKVHQEM